MQLKKLASERGDHALGIAGECFRLSGCPDLRPARQEPGEILMVAPARVYSSLNDHDIEQVIG